MKLKQKDHRSVIVSRFRSLSYISLAGSLLLVFILSLLWTVPQAFAAGACSKNAAYTDPCMEANRQKTTLSPTDFNKAVHACEGRDTGGALSGVSFDSQSGNCSNAVASCYQQVLDKRVCTNDTDLAYAADGSLGGNNGDLNGEQWDAVIDDTNSFTGGTDLQTNHGIKTAREDAYKKQIESSKVCDSRGSAPAAEQCKKDLISAFDQCYSNLGGEHAAVQQSALDTCVNQKRQQLAQNATECEAAGGQWDSTTQGPGIQRCKAKPASQSPGSGNTTPGTSGSNGGDAGNCGTARTNLISCSETDPIQVIGAVLKQVIGILSIGIGIAAVGGIGYAAVQYASATDNATQAQNAIGLIRNIVIGVLVYGFMIAIINWLVPGGVIQG